MTEAHATAIERAMTDPDSIEKPLLARLAELGISPSLYRHAPLHTVAESRALRGTMPGGHIKNLFVRDKKRTFWLITVPEDAEIDLKAMRRLLGTSGTLSFGTAEMLADKLGVLPGAVTPFAVMNDRVGDVAFVLERSLLEPALINAHPLHNEATIAMAPTELLRFVEACDHPPILFDLEELTKIMAQRKRDGSA